MKTPEFNQEQLEYMAWRDSMAEIHVIGNSSRIVHPSLPSLISEHEEVTADEKLYIWNGIDGELESVKDLEDAKRYVKIYIDTDSNEGIHPDIECIYLLSRVGSITVTKTEGDEEEGTDKYKVDIFPEYHQSKSMPSCVLPTQEKWNAEDHRQNDINVNIIRMKRDYVALYRQGWHDCKKFVKEFVEGKKGDSSV